VTTSSSWRRCVVTLQQAVLVVVLVVSLMMSPTSAFVTTIGTAAFTQQSAAPSYVYVSTAAAAQASSRRQQGFRNMALDATKKRRSSSSTGGAGFASGNSATKSKTNRNKQAAASTSTFQFDKGPGIENYLSPRLLQDPAIMEDVALKLRAGEIVVLRDAFHVDFAQAMHQELNACEAWTKNEAYFADGYHYKHDNVYDPADFSPLFVKANAMFGSNETRAFMTNLTGRDCSGDDTVGAPSHYAPGDHSLPHTDHIGQRTVAYVWHLSSPNWRPEWGGGLYWANEPLANAYLHASFNTLVLFSVTPFSVSC
jgi:hypothetical protein